ncbi:winged helix-turn-helix domain-containing protein [Timonella sp. A28]|uniref:winged helix-turn-helix domain-containing protein n=1 Tax=Timonella sp. A28 TaxID=3442640 RepID=UPI003EBEA576
MSAPTHELPPAATNQPGFYLWVGLTNTDSDTTDATTVPPAQIIEIAEALGELARELLPSAETHTTLALGGLELTTHHKNTPVNASDIPAHAHGTQRYVAPYTPRRDYATDVPANTRAESAKRLNASEPADYARDTSLPNFDFVLSPRVIIDLHNRRVIADSEVQKLTYKEFELLAYLVNSTGRIISRDELFSSVWRTSTHSDSRTIDVHIRRLREKLGLEHHIITVRGSGYKFEITEQVDVIPPAPRSLRNI